MGKVKQPKCDDALPSMAHLPVNERLKCTQAEGHVDAHSAQIMEGPKLINQTWSNKRLR